MHTRVARGGSESAGRVLSCMQIYLHKRAANIAAGTRNSTYGKRSGYSCIPSEESFGKRTLEASMLGVGIKTLFQTVAETSSTRPHFHLITDPRPAATNPEVIAVRLKNIL